MTTGSDRHSLTLAEHQHTPRERADYIELMTVDDMKFALAILSDRRPLTFDELTVFVGRARDARIRARLRAEGREEAAGDPTAA